uniref:Capon-like protein n=1 Tax=Parascaris univalens TaxID=6257 RepID=A0A915B2P6_PARUN
MIRLPHVDDDEKALSEEQRFYYLRLMAKPGDKKEPIKTKFVRWAPPCPAQNSVETDQDLESQAMRVVRTIGQAFEVCHKVAQEQMQEKLQEDAESNNNLKGKGSIISEEDVQQLTDVEEKLAKVEEASQSPSVSPDPAPPPPAPPLFQKRHSLFQPSRKSSEASQKAAIEAAAAATIAAREAAKDLKDTQQPSTSSEQQRSSVVAPRLSAALPTNPTAAYPPSYPSVSGSATLPHSQTWGPQLAMGQYQSVQSLDQHGVQQPIPFYPMPLIGPSASMPYGLSSPLMVSPYATLQLPPRHASAQQMPTSDHSIAGSPPEGRDLTALQLSMSLDQYNQHLIRSQLDQAQQTAQVASCQVQLLRDQLTSETTARIEAQSRTHQLLNANRELLEQVQALVGRLQTLESRLAAEIQSPENQPSTSKAPPPPTIPPRLPVSSTAAGVSPAVVPSTIAHSYHEQYAAEPRLPGPPPIDPSRPYQLQTLADIRAGSLPPKGNDPGGDAPNAHKKRRPIDDTGVRTEPESGAEDTTDYSSSDQYERLTSTKVAQGRASPPFPQLDVLMSNPQVMPNLSSFFSAQPLPMHYIPNYMSYPPQPKKAGTPPSSVKVSGDDDQQPGSLNSPPSVRRMREKMSGVLKEREFNRMSFNPKLRRELPEASGGIAEESEDNHNDDPQKREERRSEEGLRPEESGGSSKRRADKEESINATQSRTTIESLFKNEDEESSAVSINRPNNLVIQDVMLNNPSSSNLATAMYPPRRSGIPLRTSRPETLMKRGFRALSVEVGDSPLLQAQGNGPIAMADSTRISRIDFSKQKPTLQSVGSSDEMLSLQEALKQGLAGTTHQLFTAKDDIDGMKSARRLMETSKHKLSDPTTLARLTHNPLPKAVEIRSADSQKQQPNGALP